MKSNGVTALGIAAYQGSIEMMQALVDGGCDIKHTNNQGIGPMFMAIKSNQIDSIRFLLGKQLPVWLKGQAHSRDNSPVFYAIRQRNMAALELFADRNTEEMNHAVDSHGSNVIMYAASVCNFDAVNYLSVRGVKLDVEDREGKTLLMRILMADLYDLASKLISRGADINF